MGPWEIFFQFLANPCVFVRALLFVFTHFTWLLQSRNGISKKWPNFGKNHRLRVPPVRWHQKAVAPKFASVNFLFLTSSSYAASGSTSPKTRSPASRWTTWSSCWSRTTPTASKVSARLSPKWQVSVHEKDRFRCPNISKLVSHPNQGGRQLPLSLSLSLHCLPNVQFTLIGMCVWNLCLIQGYFWFRSVLPFTL